ncbi:MAG: hypothetical protein GY704_02225, partial [Phycisphaeraceae bacterium]|nr:hypothetical protein [Phycisphaeraceae bacterium]
MCLRPFGVLRRKHHCRRCGFVVCATCSPHRLQVPGYGTAAQRVCTNCSVK